MSSGVESIKGKKDPNKSETVYFRMQKVFNELTQAFRKHDGVLTEEQYKTYCYQAHNTYLKIVTLFSFYYKLLAILSPKKMLIHINSKHVFTSHEEQRYCVIDIETNGSKTWYFSGDRDRGTYDTRWRDN